MTSFFLKNDREVASVWSLTMTRNAIHLLKDHPKSSSQLASLETLARVDTPFIRQSSMSGIRSLHSSDSIPFLIKQLDFPDDTYTQYLALISLVEITGKGGSEFGPAMNFFERDPQRYIKSWKLWWSEQARADSAPNDH